MSESRIDFVLLGPGEDSEGVVGAAAVGVDGRDIGCCLFRGGGSSRGVRGSCSEVGLSVGVVLILGRSGGVLEAGNIVVDGDFPNGEKLFAFSDPADCSPLGNGDGLGDDNADGVPNRLWRGEREGDENASFGMPTVASVLSCLSGEGVGLNNGVKVGAVGFSAMLGGGSRTVSDAPLSGRVNVGAIGMGPSGGAVDFWPKVEGDPFEILLPFCGAGAPV